MRDNARTRQKHDSRWSWWDCSSLCREWRSGDKVCPWREKQIRPARLRQDGWIHGFDESLRLAGKKVTVGVDLRSHIGGQLPARREAQRPLSGGNHKQESNHEDHGDDDPIMSFALKGFHGYFH